MLHQSPHQGAVRLAHQKGAHQHAGQQPVVVLQGVADVVEPRPAGEDIAVPRVQRPPAHFAVHLPALTLQEDPLFKQKAAGGGLPKAAQGRPFRVDQQHGQPHAHVQGAQDIGELFLGNQGKQCVLHENHLLFQNTVVYYNHIHDICIIL